MRVSSHIQQLQQAGEVLLSNCDPNLARCVMGGTPQLPSHLIHFIGPQRRPLCLHSPAIQTDCAAMFTMTTQPGCFRHCGASLRGPEGRAVRLVVRAQAPKAEGVRAALKAVR